MDGIIASERKGARAPLNERPSGWLLVCHAVAQLLVFSQRCIIAGLARCRIYDCLVTGTPLHFFKECSDLHKTFPQNLIKHFAIHVLLKIT